MPVFNIQSPDGTEYEIEGPNGATKEQAFEFFKREHAAGRVKPKEKVVPKQAPGFVDQAIGAGEAALSMITGGLVQPIAGIAGLVNTARKGADVGARTVEQGMKDFTYQPRSEVGKKLNEKLGDIFSYLPEKAGDLGEKVAGNTGRTIAQAGTEIAQNFVPLPFLKGRGSKSRGAAPEARPVAEILAETQAKPPEALKALEHSVIDEQGVRIPGSQLEAVKAAKAQQMALRQQQARAAADAARPMQSFYNQMSPEEVAAHREATRPEGLRDRQQELPFDTGVEEIAARQAERSPQMDMFVEDYNRQKNYDPYAETQRVAAEGQRNIDAMAQEEAMKPRVDEQLDLFNERENVIKQKEMDAAFAERDRQLQQEQMQRQIDDAADSFMPLEEQLRRDAYQPPTNEQVRQSRGRPVKASQRGGIDFEEISKHVAKVGNLFGKKETIGGNVSGTLPNIPPTSVPNRPDSLATPRSAENIAAKQKVAQKARVLGLDTPEYTRVTTLEEAKALAKNAEDIKHNPVRNATVSGLEGMIRLNARNPILNYARTVFQDARNSAEVFSKRYVTGANGVVKAYRSLKPGEWPRVAEVMMELGKAQVDPTPELLAKFGLNERQQNVVSSFHVAFDKLLEDANKALTQNGHKPIERRAGYSPAVFPGGYRALAVTYRVNADGTKKMSTRAVINADTRAEFKKAQEHYASQGMEIVPLKRRTLNTNARESTMFNGFNDIINLIAEHDPDFAATKAVGDAAVASKVKSLYNFDVHEMKKVGVQGSAGDKPWVSKDQNAKEYLEGLINHLEEGAKYYNYQNALADVGKIINDPEIKMPNAKAYLEGYAKHITGQNLNPIGAAGNFVLDNLANMMGVSYKIPSGIVGEVGNLSAIHMMGTWNPAFLGMQLTQYFTGGLPEGLKLGSAAGLAPDQITRSFSMGGIWNTALYAEKVTGKNVGEAVPSHVRDAQKWAIEHGIMDMSERELAHAALQNDKYVKAKQVASLPMSLGERATRPGIFLAYTDMLHQAGLRGDELHHVAQNATDFAMGNYHPDERPQMYSSLGVLGRGMGQLTTFKHNQLTQWVSRGVDAKEGKGVAPLAAMLTMSVGLAGVTGLPFYGEVDSIYQKLSDGMRLRDFLLGAESNKPNEWMDGVLSVKTGFDFQSRLGMNRVIPDNLGAVFNPQIAHIWDMTSKVLDYAKHRDEMSFNEMTKALTPQGMKGFVEDLDAEGQPMTKEGNSLFGPEMDRTPLEQDVKKWTNIRPIRETTERADVWATQKRVAAQRKELTELSRRMEAAISLGDWAGYSQHGKEYVEKGGDPSKVYNKQMFEKVYGQKTLSERQRMGGIAPKSLSDIVKYQEFNK